MTINTAINRVVYVGPGNDFSYPYAVFADADVYVALEDTGGVVTEPSLNGAGTYDFTVAGAYDDDSQRYPNGVTVTLNTAAPAGYTVAIECRPASTQGADFTEGGPLPAETLETALDRLTVQQQAQAAAINRCVQQPATGGGDIRIPVAEANKTLVWDAAGVNLTNGPTTTEIENAETNAAEAAASAGEAAASEANAAASAQAADNSAVMAQSYAASIGKTETVTGDATITITDNGTLWTVLATSPVTITLPLISEAGEPFLARIKRDGASTADVTVSPSGTDQIGGAASLVLDGADQGVQCFADIDATPDNWEVGEFGPGVSAALETRVAQNETDIAANAAAIASLKAGTAVLYEYGPDGENAGATVAGAWTPRGINLKAVVSKPFVSVSGHKFTLLPGKYRIRTKSPFIYCNGSRTRLYDETHAAVVDGSLSLSVQSGGTSYYFQPSYAEGVCEVVIAEATTCFVDYIASVAYALGLGCHDALAAGEEYFGRIEIERLA